MSMDINSSSSNHRNSVTREPVQQEVIPLSHYRAGAIVKAMMADAERDHAD